MTAYSGSTLIRPGDAAAFVRARVAEAADYLKVYLEDGVAPVASTAERIRNDIS
jgi:hypothetical protein